MAWRSLFSTSPLLSARKQAGSTKQPATMTVIEKATDTVKDVLGTSEEPRKWTSYPIHSSHKLYPRPTAIESAYLLLTLDRPYVGRATREEMSAARLPLAYRDSCAHLAIPLNRCRFEQYYLPWKCVVGYMLGRSRWGVADDVV